MIEEEKSDKCKKDSHGGNTFNPGLVPYGCHSAGSFPLEEQSLLLALNNKILTVERQSLMMTDS